MALSTTGKAIGAVSKLLTNHLVSSITGVNVTVGRPQDAAKVKTSTLNLFLYEIQFDPGLRQTELIEGQPAPLWLVLKYLLTAFDGDEKSGYGSDNIVAHSLLGQGMQALHELSLSSISKSASALLENPEELQLKFEDASSDLLSKLMQGSEEQYRCSVSFEIRPIMIAASKASPSYSLLVGIDYTDKGVIREDRGIEDKIQVTPSMSMGPLITTIYPELFDVDPDYDLPTLTIEGSNLNLSDLSVKLGSVELSIIAPQASNRLQCEIPKEIRNGRIISAGSYPLSVVWTMSPERNRSSNLLVANLLPILKSATPKSISKVGSDSNFNVFGEIRLEGFLLGTKQDNVFVALYKDGKVEQLFDKLTPQEKESQSESEPNLLQQITELSIPQTKAVPPGKYRVILIVNHQQARNSPEILLEVAS